MRQVGQRKPMVRRVPCSRTRRPESWYGRSQERVECDAGGGECEQENENSGQRRESKAGERRVRARRSRQESEGGAGVVTGRRVRATVLERQPRLA